jgi:hypothetical protein
VFRLTFAFPSAIIYKLRGFASLLKDEFGQPICGGKGPGPSVAQVHVGRLRIHPIGDDRDHNYVSFTYT